MVFEQVYREKSEWTFQKKRKPEITCAIPGEVMVERNRLVQLNGVVVSVDGNGGFIVTITSTKIN